MMKALKQAPSRREYWQELIAQQQKSGQAMTSFCQQHGVSVHSFYSWRKRLSAAKPVGFALVQTPGTGKVAENQLELCLGGGDRLLIGPGIDATTLRTVLAVLRDRS